MVLFQHAPSADFAGESSISSDGADHEALDEVGPSSQTPSPDKASYQELEPPKPASPSDTKFDPALVKYTESRSFWGGVQFAGGYIYAECRRQPAAYIWSATTVFISVLVLTVIISALARSSLVFFRMAEEQTGEQDIIFTPGAGITDVAVAFPAPLPLLNQTIIDLALAGRGTPYARNIEGWTGDLDGPHKAQAMEVPPALLAAQPLTHTPHAHTRTVTGTPLSIGGVGFGPAAYVEDGHVRVAGVRTAAADLVNGVAGRQLLSVEVVNATVHHAAAGTEADAEVVGSTAVTATFAGIDSAREQYLGLGRLFAERHTAVPQHALFLARSVLRGTGAGDGVLQAVRDEARARGDDITPYQQFNRTSGRWEGEGRPPRVSVSARVDFGALLALGGLASGAAGGAGLRDDPYLVRSVSADAFGSLMAAAGVPPPNGTASWTTWLAAPVTSELGPPSGWLDWETAAAQVQTLVPAEAVALGLEVEVRVPLSSLCAQWQALGFTPLDYTVQRDWYRYAPGVGCPLPISPEPLRVLLVPDTSGSEPVYAVDTVALDESYARALAAATQQGASRGAWVSAALSIVIGTRADVRLAVADVVEDPAGKWAESLGSVALAEVRQAVAVVRESLQQALDGEAALAPREVSLAALLSGAEVRVDGVLVPVDAGTATVPFAPAPVNPLALLGLDASAVGPLLDGVRGQEAVATTFLTIGAGAAPIGDAYDAAYVPEGAQAALANTSSVAMVGPGIHAPTRRACAPCQCTASLACSLAAVARTASMLSTRALSAVGLGALANALGITAIAEATPLAQSPLAAALGVLPRGIPLAEDADAPTPLRTPAGARAVRQRMYSGSEAAVDSNMSRVTTAAALALGPLFPASVSMPLLEAVRGSLFMRYFLDSLLVALVFVILLIAALTTYALFQTDTDAHTYTFAMLRASGLKASQLAMLLVGKALLIAAVGTLAGLGGAALVMLGVGQYLDAQTQAADSSSLTTTAIAVGVSAGVLVPLAATIVPVQRALGQTLVEALAPHRTALSAVTVTIRKLAEVGVHPYQAAAAVLLVAFGFICFYLIPLAFLNNDIPMFLTLLMLILLAMLAGLVMVVYALTPTIAGTLGWLVTLGQPATRKLLTQHLRAHWPRARWYALQLCLSVAFIVFAGSLLRLQLNSLAATIRVFSGAPLVITAPRITNALPVDNLAAAATALTALPPTNALAGVVLAHSFVTFSVRDGLREGLRRYTRLSSLAQYPWIRQAVYGLDPQYAQATYNALYVEQSGQPGAFGSGLQRMLAEGDIGNDDDVQAAPPALASGWGAQSVAAGVDGRFNELVSVRENTAKLAYGGLCWGVMNAAVQTRLGVDATSTYAIRVTQRGGSSSSDADVIPGPDQDSFWVLARARAIASRVPGFVFSSYDLLATAGAVLLPEDTLARVMRLPKGDMARERMFVGMRSDATAAQRQDVSQTLVRAAVGEAATTDEDSITALDTETLVQTMADAVGMLEVLFTALSGAVMALAGIMAAVTIEASVRAQAWEIGVLRAVGLRRAHVVWLFVLETLVLCVASIAVGTAIGLAVAVSLTLLFNVFMDAPFEMAFPGDMFAAVVCMGVGVSALAAAVPAMLHTQAPISQALRKL